MVGDVHWACNWSCAWSFDCSHGKSLHRKWSNSRKFPLFISDTSQISFRLSSWPLTAIFCIAVKIKHSIITCKYFLLNLTCSLCALLSCYRTLLFFVSIALNCSHLVMQLTWFSLLPCFVNFDGFSQFLKTKDASFPNSMQAKHTHTFSTSWLSHGFFFIPVRLESSSERLTSELGARIFG